MSVDVVLNDGALFNETVWLRAWFTGPWWVSFPIKQHFQRLQVLVLKSIMNLVSCPSSLGLINYSICTSSSESDSIWFCVLLPIIWIVAESLDISIQCLSSPRSVGHSGQARDHYQQDDSTKHQSDRHFPPWLAKHCVYKRPRRPEQTKRLTHTDQVYSAEVLEQTFAVSVN